MEEEEESKEMDLDMANDYVSSLMNWGEDDDEGEDEAAVAASSPAAESMKSTGLTTESNHQRQITTSNLGSATVGVKPPNDATAVVAAAAAAASVQPMVGSTQQQVQYVSNVAALQSNFVSQMAANAAAGIGPSGAFVPQHILHGQHTSATTTTTNAPAATISVKPPQGLGETSHQQQIVSFPQHLAPPSHQQHHQLHPLAIQSSATCPPHLANTVPTVNFNLVNGAMPNTSFMPLAVYNRLLQTATTTQQHQQLPITVQTPGTISAAHGKTQQATSSLQPRTQIAMASAAPAPTAAHDTGMSVTSKATVAQPTKRLQNLSTTTTGPQHPTVPSADSKLPASEPQQAKVSLTSDSAARRTQHQKQHHSVSTTLAPNVHTAHAGTGAAEGNSASTMVASAPQSTLPPPPIPRNLPPFFLFDAPVELRTNFLTAQRMHNLPTLQDNNSVHYGMTVNGFHPQLNAQINPILPMGGSVAGTNPGGGAGGSLASQLPASAIKLIDGRGKKPRSGRERNEREQKRAAKITELIDKLRTSMETGGWKVEMRSKYHTLSTCADYVKHLIETTKKKEEAVEKAKSDLQMKERKLEEKALAESRSDPESVASTLTASTTESRDVAAQQSSASRPGPVQDTEEGDGNPFKEGDSKPATKATKDDQKHPQEDVPTARGSATGAKDGSESSSGSDQGSGPGVQNVSVDKMSSSISDVTDSNRGSSEGSGNSNKDDENKKQSGSKTKKRPNAGEEGNTTSITAGGNSSISSTAAVVRGEGSRGSEHGHADVVVRVKRQDTNHRFSRNNRRSLKRKHREKEKNNAAASEKTSLESDFELDYEEVFLSSNVPQLIATPAGRIVSVNDFFLQATGMTKDDVHLLTIFSLVKPEKLSNLFQIVAEALRETNSPTPNNNNNSNSVESRSTGSGNTTRNSGSTSSSASGSDENVAQQPSNLAMAAGARHEFNYAAITLPCISFPNKSIVKESSKSNHHPKPLYMTVTLMPDEDPKKRCFHCVITDCPGTNGQMGFLTPELLTMLFLGHSSNDHHRKKKKRKGSSHHKPPMTSVFSGSASRAMAVEEEEYDEDDEQEVDTAARGHIKAVTKGASQPHQRPRKQRKLEPSDGNDASGESNSADDGINAMSEYQSGDAE